MKKFSRDYYKNGQGRHLAAKARLARAIVEENLYYEFKKRTYFYERI